VVIGMVVTATYFQRNKETRMLNSHDRARIAERVANDKPAQRDSERLFDSLSKQNYKSEYESELRERIAIERAVRDGCNKT
jgi:hypothetical protein